MWAAGSWHCSRRKEHLEYMKVLCSQDVEITSKAWHWFVSRFDFFVVLAIVTKSSAGGFVLMEAAQRQHGASFAPFPPILALKVSD